MFIEPSRISFPLRRCGTFRSSGALKMSISLLYTFRPYGTVQWPFKLSWRLGQTPVLRISVSSYLLSTTAQ